MAKRLSIVLNAMGQESGLWDLISATAKSAPERESALVLSAAGQAFNHRRNHNDPLPDRDKLSGVGESTDYVWATIARRGDTRRVVGPGSV
jgi:hypothetical protein